MGFQSGSHEVEEIPGKEQKEGMHLRGYKKEGDQTPDLALTDKRGIQGHAGKGLGIHGSGGEKEHLAGEKQEGQVGEGISAKAKLERGQSFHRAVEQEGLRSATISFVVSWLMRGRRVGSGGRNTRRKRSRRPGD